MASKMMNMTLDAVEIEENQGSDAVEKLAMAAEMAKTFRPKLITSSPIRPERSTKFQTELSGATLPIAGATRHTKVQETEGDPPPAPGVDEKPTARAPDAFLEQYGRPLRATMLDCGTAAQLAEPILVEGTDIWAMTLLGAERTKGKKGKCTDKKVKRLHSVKTRNARAAAKSNVTYSGGELDRLHERI